MSIPFASSSLHPGKVFILSYAPGVDVSAALHPLHVPMRHDHDSLHVVLLSHEGASFLEEALDLCKAALHGAVEANLREAGR